jgi:tellurite resistance protein
MFNRFLSRSLVSVSKPLVEESALHWLAYGSRIVPKGACELSGWLAVLKISSLGESALSPLERFALLAQMKRVNTSEAIIAQVLETDPESLDLHTLVEKFAGRVAEAREKSSSHARWFVYESLWVASGDGRLEPEEVEAVVEVGRELGLTDEALTELITFVNEELDLRQRRLYLLQKK